MAPPVNSSGALETVTNVMPNLPPGGFDEVRTVLNVVELAVLAVEALAGSSDMTVPGEKRSG